MNHTTHPRISPQMRSLLERYGVATRRQLIDAIIAEAWVETGVRLTQRAGMAVLDQMLEAEFQRLDGLGQA